MVGGGRGWESEGGEDVMGGDGKGREGRDRKIMVGQSSALT